jgi:hypothetical protein
MRLSAHPTCLKFDEVPLGHLFVFTEHRKPIIGVKVWANPPREPDKLEGYRPAPPPKKEIGYAALSATPQVFFDAPTNKLVLDIDAEASLVPDLLASAPKDTHAPGIIFFGKGKTWLSVKFATTRYDHVIGHINIATGEFERNLNMNDELAVANWRVVLSEPLPGLDLATHGLAA